MAGKVYKVTDVTDVIAHKYVFVGPTTAAIEKILAGIRCRADVADLPTQSIKSLAAYFGERWQYTLGIRKGYVSSKTDVFHWVRFVVSNDDSIKALKVKLFAVIAHYRYYIRPEWQHLWSAHDGALGTVVVDIRDAAASHVAFEPDIRKVVAAVWEDQDELMRFAAKSAYRVDSLPDTVLADFDLPNEEILLTTLPSVLRGIRGTLAGFPARLRQPVIVQRALFRRYFPDALGTPIFGLLESDTFDIGRASSIDRDRIVSKAQQENLSAVLLRQLSQRAEKPDIQIKSVSLELPPYLGTDDAELDLQALFVELQIDDQLVFVCYRATKKSGAGVRYKLRKDRWVSENDLKLVKDWLNPSDEDRRPNILVLKFRVAHSLISFTLSPNGGYRVALSWPQRSGAVRLGDVKGNLKFLQAFLTNHGIVSREVPLLYKNMSVAFELQSARPYDFAALRSVYNCFPSYVSVASEQAEIERFLQKTQGASKILKKLTDAGLNDITKLALLSRQEWAGLRLSTSPANNERLVEGFRAFVLGKTSSGIRLFYKRHSRYDTLLLYRKLIAEYMTSHHLQLSHIIGNPEDREAVRRELSNRFNLTASEAESVVDGFAENVNAFQRRMISRVSTGIKCFVAPLDPRGTTQRPGLRVNVTGIKSFTADTDVDQLLDNMASFFAQATAAYQDRLAPSCEATQPDAVELDNEDLDFDDLEDLDDIPQPSGAASTSTASPPPTAVAVQGAVAEMKSSSRAALAAPKGKYHLQQLLQHDRVLFDKQDGQTWSFATKCQGARQPVVMSSAEYDNQRGDATGGVFQVPAGTPDGFRYRDNYYICPEIWCPTLRRALRPADVVDAKWEARDLNEDGVPVPKVVAGKCPDGEAAIFRTDGVNAWKAKGISKSDPFMGRHEFPGFLTPVHADGTGVPCCFKHDQSESNQKARFFSFMNSAEIPKPGRLDEGQRRYILDEKKAPIERHRFGRLPERLDRRMNERYRSHSAAPKVYGDSYRQVLRVGTHVPNQTVPSSTFISAMAIVANLYFEEDRFPTTQDFQRFLAEKVATDPMLTRCLRNGDLKSMFEDFPGDDYVANYSRYLAGSRVEHDQVWDLLSRAIPWLFRDGINIFLLQYADDGDVRLVCPRGENLDTFYQAQRKSVVIVTNGKVFEPLARVSGALEVNPFFSPSTGYKALYPFLKMCSTVADRTPFYPASVVQRLAAAGCPPAGQVVNLYNRVRYLSLPDGSLIPTDPGGPVYGLPMVGLVSPTLSVQVAVSQMLSTILDADFRVTALVPPSKAAMVLESGRVKQCWARTGSGRVVPVTVDVSSASLGSSFPIDRSRSYDEIDDEIYVGDVQEDARVRHMSQLNFLKETFHRLRYEVSSFLKRDLREVAKSGKKSKRYWFLVDNILRGVDKRGIPLPIWAKRSLLARLFFEGDVGQYSALGDVLVTTTARSSDGIPLNYGKPASPRRTCSARVGATAATCSTDVHCHWHGKCKLFVPAGYYRLFTMLIIEELLRSTARGDTLLENEIDGLVRNREIVITENSLQFDGGVAEYVVYLLERFDLRTLKEADILSTLAPRIPQVSLADRVKEHVVYQAFAADYVRDQQAKSLGLEEPPPALARAAPGALWARGHPTSVAAIATALSAALGSTITPSVLRERLAHEVRAASWRQYAASAGKFDPELKSAKSLDRVVATIMNPAFRGSPADLDLIARIYHPLQIVCLQEPSYRKRVIASGHPQPKPATKIKTPVSAVWFACAKGSVLPLYVVTKEGVRTPVQPALT